MKRQSVSLYQNTMLKTQFAPIEPLSYQFIINYSSLMIVMVSLFVYLTVTLPEKQNINTNSIHNDRNNKRLLEKKDLFDKKLKVVTMRKPHPVTITAPLDISHIFLTDTLEINTVLGTALKEIVQQHDITMEIRIYELLDNRALGIAKNTALKRYFSKIPRVPETALTITTIFENYPTGNHITVKYYATE
jgi:hypothetical protein